MTVLTIAETVGILAAGMTVAAFSCRQMMLLRIAAIAANGLFIAYALMLDLKPVLALHCILLPLNIVRLIGLKQPESPAGSKAQ